MSYTLPFFVTVVFKPEEVIGVGAWAWLLPGMLGEITQQASSAAENNGRRVRVALMRNLLIIGLFYYRTVHLSGSR